MPIIDVPGLDEWDTSRLEPSRTAYLEGKAFEEIVGGLICGVTVLKSKICKWEGRDCNEGGKRAEFVVAVGSVAVDLLHNSRDGLRGRFWQAPYLGDAATRHLIDMLKPKLLEYAHRKWDAERLGEIERSISQATAKVWIRERSEIESKPDMHPEVRRWRENEPEINDGGMWRHWWPDLAEIEVKGAWLSPAGLQFVPKIKWCRACQISQFGFS